MKNIQWASKVPQIPRLVDKHPGLDKVLEQPAVPVQRGYDHPNLVGLNWHFCINDLEMASNETPGITWLCVKKRKTLIKSPSNRYVIQLLYSFLPMGYLSWNIATCQYKLGISMEPELTHGSHEDLDHCPKRFADVGCHPKSHHPHLGRRQCPQKSSQWFQPPNI